MSKISNIVMIIDKEDTYHDWILYDFGQRFQLPIRVIGADKREVSKMKYMSILDRHEIVYIKDEEDKIIKHYKDIKQINLRKRVLVISAESKHIVQSIQKDFKGSRIIKFPELKDYKQKQAYVRKLIKRWGLECENKEVERVLERNMVRDVLSWEDVKLMWEVYEHNQIVFTIDTIDDLFPDEAFHNLDNFLEGLLEGKWKQKAMQMAYYFLEVREYSPSWLVHKIQEEYHTIGLFFQAFRGGVLIIPESKGRIEERVKGVKWENGLRLIDFKEHEQERYLSIVKRMPYKHYVKIARYVLGITGIVTKEDVYEMVENIKIIRSELKDDWGTDKKRDYKARTR